MEKSNIVPFEQPEPGPRYQGTPMKSDLVDEASKTVKDPQILINVVSQRVRQLNEGSSPLVNVLPSMGSADVALLEIIEGKIKVTSDPL